MSARAPTSLLTTIRCWPYSSLLCATSVTRMLFVPSISTRPGPVTKVSSTANASTVGLVSRSSLMTAVLGVTPQQGHEHAIVFIFAGYEVGDVAAHHIFGARPDLGRRLAVIAQQRELPPRRGANMRPIRDFTSRIAWLTL